MMMSYFDAYAARYTHYKGGSWCYEDGCVYRGLAALHEATGETRWFDHLRRLVDGQVGDDGTLKGYRKEEFSIDSILAGRGLLYLWDKTGETKYRTAADTLIDQLGEHPRTKSNVYWHKNIYPWQIWLDGLYMAHPFQVAYAKRTGREDLIADSMMQLQTALTLTHVKATRLYAHGYDESRQQAWANPVTGLSQAHWARSIGWLAMALVDVIEVVGEVRARETRLWDKTQKLLNEVATHQQPQGLWLQVMDMPDLDGNYMESSASAMFAYAMLKAARLGIPVSLSPVDAALKALACRVVPLEKTDVRMLTGICHMAGLGTFSDRRRDGTPEYYLTEPVVSDDAKGVGPLMMAYAEAETASLASDAA